jgi:Na+/melibiose symporter-like transporter
VPKERTIDFVFYALPTVGSTMRMAPAFSIVQRVYAKTYGLSLSVLAAAILIARIFDAVSDSLIGYLSDRTVAQGGRPQLFACRSFAYFMGSLIGHIPVI